MAKGRFVLAKRILFASVFLAGLMNYADASAVSLNSGFSIDNFKVFLANGDELVENGEVGCNSTFSFTFDWTIESDAGFNAGDIAYANITGRSGQNEIPYSVRSTSPIGIKNASDETVAQWYLTNSGIYIKILDAGAGLNYLQGTITTGNSMNASTCTTRDITQDVAIGKYNSDPLKKSVAFPVKIKAGTFGAVNNYTVGGIPTNQVLRETIWSPAQTINALYANGGTQVEDNEIITNLWTETIVTDELDHVNVDIHARASIPAGGTNFAGGVSGNGLNATLSACDATHTSACKMRIDANAGEGKEEYVARLKSARENNEYIPYGTWYDENTGATNIIVYIGDTPGTFKYSDVLRAQNLNPPTLVSYARKNTPYHDIETVIQPMENYLGDNNYYEGRVAYYNIGIASYLATPITVNGTPVVTTTVFHHETADPNASPVTVTKTHRNNVSVGSSGEAVAKNTASLTLLDADNKRPISGAVFELYNAGDQKIAEKTTDTNGKLQVNGLDEADGYYWKQTGFAAHYKTNNSKYYTDQNLQTQVSGGIFNISSDAGVSLYVTNERADVVITYNGGDHAASNFSTKVPSKTYRYGDAISKPDTSAINEAAQTGWLFDHWDKTIPDVATASDTYTVVWKRQTATIKGRLVWLDANDADGLRPTQVIASLVQNNTILDLSATFNSNNEVEFTGQYAYDTNGNRYTYSLNVPDTDDYAFRVYHSRDTNIVIEATHMPKTKIVVNKTWDDDGNTDGMRPDALNFAIIADGSQIQQGITMTPNQTRAESEELPKYSDLSGIGTLIEYEILENTPNFYDADIVKDSAYEFTVTNTLASPTPYIDQFDIDVHIEDGTLDPGETVKVKLTYPESDNIDKPSIAVDNVVTIETNGDPVNVVFPHHTIYAAGIYDFVLEVEPGQADVGIDNNRYTYRVIAERNPNTNEIIITGFTCYDADGNQVSPNSLRFDLYHLDPIPLEVDASVELPIDGEIEEDAIFANVEPITDGAPMPEGSENGFRVAVSADGGVELGRITYSEPGEYDYSLKLDSDEYDLSGTDFIVRVVTGINDDTNEIEILDVLLLDTDGNPIDLGSFKIRVTKREPENPATGDSVLTALMITSAAFGVSAVVFISLRRRR